MQGAQYLTSDLTGAPQLTHEAGSLIAVLDAVLVNGWGLTTVDALTFDSSTGQCTATFNSGHPFATDRIITITGSDQAAYNGEHRIEAKTSTTVVFTPATTPTANTATGAMSVKFSPLGWERTFDDGAGTKALYQPAAASRSTNCGIMLDDTNTAQNYSYLSAYHALVRGVVNPHGIDDWDEQINDGDESSVSFGGWIRKTDGTSASDNRRWVVVGNDRFFYLIVKHQSSQSYDSAVVYAFGEFESYRAGDEYNFFFMAGNCNYQSYNCTNDFGVFDGSGTESRLIARGVDQQIGKSYTAFSFYRAGNLNYLPISATSSGAFLYPNPVNGELVYSYPVELLESKLNSFTAQYTNLRGVLPGLCIPHHYKPLSADTVADILVEGVAARAAVLNVGYRSNQVQSGQIFLLLNAGGWNG
ncbi:MAG: hypothetical protein ACPGPF_00050 [Pontibacterium sp.]